MIAASALVVADDATPQLAASAVRRALERGGLTQASEVVLFLSPEFARHAAAAVAAASHVSGCLQVFGGVAAGVLGDEGWAIDRPAAAALVLAGLPAAAVPAAPRLSLCGTLHVPPAWHAAPARFGLRYADALSTAPTPVWQGARLVPDGHAELRVPGCAIDLAVSTGLAIVPARWRVERASSNELRAVVALSDGPRPGRPADAADALRAVQSPGAAAPHAATAGVAGIEVEADASGRPSRLVPIVSANADGSLTVAEPLPPGSIFRWALRSPDAAAADMQRTVAGLERAAGGRRRAPVAGVFLSCIGRGPFFHAGADHELDTFRAAFPGLPFVGAYGSGQIAPTAAGNAFLQNGVVAALLTPES